MKKIEEYKNRINELIALADRTLASKSTNRFGDTYTNTEVFTMFRSAVLSFLQNVYGKEHPYFNEFNSRVKDVNVWDCEEGKGILLSIKHEIDNGWLFNLKSLVAAEIFSDFLEMADYLLKEGYKDPAAVMVGSVLEEHIRQLCNKNGIPIETIKDGKPTSKKADLMNSELATANVYNKLDQKSITSWLDLRNKAAHGRYSEYTKEQVEIMYQAITNFISRTT